jgi:hypothetical protein
LSKPLKLTKILRPEAWTYIYRRAVEFFWHVLFTLPARVCVCQWAFKLKATLAHTVMALYLYYCSVVQPLPLATCGEGLYSFTLPNFINFEEKKIPKISFFISFKH